MGMQGWESHACTPQIPPAAGLAPGSVFHGGNCLGIVRTYGQFPDRARSIVCLQAVRRVVISDDVRMDGIKTKPSRLRHSR